MKKFLGILVLGLLWCNVGFAGSSNLKQLNVKLLEIENQIDSCINSKDKNICEKYMLENSILLEILGTEVFAKLIDSNKCKVGTKCGETMSRITAKSMQIMNFILELN